MDTEWWKPQKPGASIFDLLVTILLQFVLNTACLFLGLKIAGVKEARLGKMIWVNLIAGLVIPKSIEFILNLVGLVFNEFVSMLLGFFVVVFIIQAMFDEKFSRAFFAASLAYCFYYGFLRLMEE